MNDSWSSRVYGPDLEYISLDQKKLMESLRTFMNTVANEFSGFLSFMQLGSNDVSAIIKPEYYSDEDKIKEIHKIYELSRKYYNSFSATLKNNPDSESHKDLALDKDKRYETSPILEFLTKIYPMVTDKADRRMKKEVIENIYKNITGQDINTANILTR